MPEYLSNKKRKQSIGINSYSEYTDTTKIIGNVLVGFGSVGVGTTVPTQDVDVNTIRVRDTLFDYTNSGGVVWILSGKRY
jgi:endo-1,4-beta-mannosidase